MIFKSKKEFENAVYERMSEIDFRGKTEEKLYRLEEEVNSLRHVVNRLEDRINSLEDRLTVPQPQPYIVKPSWTGTDPVDHTPYSACGGNSTTGGDSPCTT